MALLQDAESQAVANLPAGAEELAVTIRTLSHTLYALLATLATGRSLRLVQRVPNRNGFEAMAAENAPKTAGRRFAMLQAAPQPRMSDNPAKFEETRKSWEHQVDVYEKLVTSKLDDDVKISVVLREAPQKLRDHLLVNSQQCERDYNKLRAIIQAYMNTNKTTSGNRSNGIGLHRQEQRQKQEQMQQKKEQQRDRNQSKGKSKSKSNGKSSGKPDNDKECYVCRKKGHFARDCSSRDNRW